jgi:DNA-directed RNA polymerase subunit beta
LKHIWDGPLKKDGTKDVVRNDDDVSIFCACPIFDAASEKDILTLLKKADLPTNGKTVLFDGLSGDKISDNITIGNIYVMKLLHLVDDKIHARSTGPYSLVTQQPLGGKAQFGGQRFGKWKSGHFSYRLLRTAEMLIKSDDVVGRVKTYESIVQEKY